MLDSFLNLFNKSKLNNNTNEVDDHLMLISGILVETAAIDGKVDNSEHSKIIKSLIYFFQVSEDKISHIVKKCLERTNEPNSLHYFTSRINKEFEYERKIKLLEIMWEIVLADGKIHDYESNMIRRLSGLLYISDVDSGNAKKRVSTKIIRN